MAAFRRDSMKKYVLLLSLLSSYVSASDQDLREILTDCAARARAKSGISTEKEVSAFHSFASMADAKGNFHEPEHYLTHLQQGTMNKKTWLDLAAYLNETDIPEQKRQKFERAVTYARSHAYN
jgi:hypothetical protein